MTGFPLPPYAHLPGVNARHDPALFAGLKAATPSLTADATARANPAWLHGLELFQAGFFWECHEALEPVWRNAPPNSRERAAAQGVIQLANGRLKLRLGRRRAAMRLGAIAAAHFDAAGERTMALDMAAARAIAAALAAGRESDIPLKLTE